MTAHLWEKSYPPGVSWGAPMPPPVAIESILDKAAANWPARVAIDFYDKTLTFAQLHDLAIRAAKGFQALGVGPGVNVGLHLPNTPHYVVCFFAVLMAGGRVANFSPLAAPRELKYQIVDSDVQVMVTLGIRRALSADRGAQGHGEVRDPRGLQSGRFFARAGGARVRRPEDRT